MRDFVLGAIVIFSFNFNDDFNTDDKDLEGLLSSHLLVQKSDFQENWHGHSVIFSDIHALPCVSLAIAPRNLKC